MYPILSGISTFAADHQIGAATVAGVAISAYSIGNLASSLLGPIQKIFKGYTTLLGYLLCVAGLALLLFIPSVPTMIIGCLIAGAGFMIVFSMLQVFNGIINDSASIALGTTLILIGNQLGIFISNYFILAAHAVFRRQSDIESVFLGAIIVFAVFAVLSAVRGVIVPKEN